MKKLGKLMLFVGAMTLTANFTACKSDDPDVVIVEDGFYLAGTATGSDELNVDYRLAAGINEADNQKKRDGMYEKYVALEAGKEFYLFLKEGNTETRYGATLEDKNITGENDQPGSEENPFVLKKGSLKIGESAPSMKVDKDGLYHIVLDLNKDKALDLVGGAQIIIVPVEWGTNVAIDDVSNWWKKMTPSAFNIKTMSWTINVGNSKEGNFKFAYGSGWKIQLDDAGKVKANTNLGVDMIQGGKDISIDKGEGVNIKLTWKLASGEISNSYSMDLNATKWDYVDYSKVVFGLIGSAFYLPDGTTPDTNWTTDVDLAYNASKSTITDATKFHGTYVYEASNVVFIAGGEFKIRKDHDWGVNFGYSADNIKGNDTGNFSDNGGNIKVTAGGTYDVMFKYTAPAKTWEVTFTKK